jgi:pectate lyase
MKFSIKRLIVLLLLSSGPLLAEEPGIPAFPGAEGFGAQARGGRGGDVLFVTNLNDSGPGSLREAIQSKGPRTVVFRVSGLIALKSGLQVRQPFITIAGQTAPGDGICLKNFGFVVRTHVVIVRHMRFRPGDEPAKEYAKRGRTFAPDAVSIIAPSHDVIFDHCSASWSVDECFSVSGAGITNVTAQWCIISESLNKSVHPKGEHGYGSLLRCNGNISFHHNLYAHHKSRSPRPGTYGEGSILLDFRNHLIYDSKGYSAADPVRMNYVGNYIRRPRGSVFQVGGPTTKLFVEGNVLHGDEQASRDNWEMMAGNKASSRMKTPFAVAPVHTDKAQEAAARILAECGATLPRRDAIDKRILEQISTDKGDLINSQRDVGGWPHYESARPPLDADQDGMPDTWEAKYKLDPRAQDHNQDADGDGYTNLEEWLNQTDPGKKDTK